RLPGDPVGRLAGLEGPPRIVGDRRCSLGRDLLRDDLRQPPELLRERFERGRAHGSLPALPHPRGSVALADVTARLVRAPVPPRAGFPLAKTLSSARASISAWRRISEALPPMLDILVAARCATRLRTNTYAPSSGVASGTGCAGRHVSAKRE